MADSERSVPLYHLVQAGIWTSLKENGAATYIPPTYEADGFIHLTRDPELLLGVANHFYKGIGGDWLVLTVDQQSLEHEVKFETAAPVGTTAAHVVGGKEEPLFPHLYGPMELAAVTAETRVERDADGCFLRILWPAA